MDIHVRFATAEDAPVLHQFIRALALHWGESERIACTADDLAAQLAAQVPPFDCLIAHCDSKPVGIALFYASFSTWRGRPALVLEDLFVLEAYRRRYIGKRLLIDLSRVAAHRGCTSVQWQGRAWDEASIQFFRAIGAVQLVDRTRHRLDSDALVGLACTPAPGSDESRETSGQKLISDHPLVGSEFTWVCTDRAGLVAAFCINKEGPIPAAALGDAALMDRTYEALDGLAPCGTSVLLGGREPDAYYSARLAERGIFAYDWRPAAASYVLTAAPSEPRRLDDLRTADDRRGASLVTLSTNLLENAEFGRSALEAALSPAAGPNTQ